MSFNCPICAKHQGEGPLVGPTVWQDDLVIVTHRPLGADGRVFLGYLFLETRRHAPALDDLTEVEALAVARTAWRAARGLRAELSPEFIFSAIIGQAVRHFHQHLFVRYSGTPKEYDWMQVEEWPQAPRGGVAEVNELCLRLRPYLKGTKVPPI
jgi:ATP adenylyltransferase